MTVEARRLNAFRPQLRDTMNVDGSPYAAGVVGYLGSAPLPGITIGDPFFPMYCSSAVDTLQAKNAMKSESGLTYGLPPSRKRPREEFNPLNAYPALHMNSNNRCGSLSFLGEDILLQLQKQQLDVDRLVAQHMEKVRTEIQERRKLYARSILAAIEQQIRNRLRAKDEEIENIGKLNWALEERVKSLSVENQIWRELAQTNEATANFLRSNLEQVIADAEQRRGSRAGEGGELLDDAQSCCGSNDGVEAEADGCGVAESGGEVGTVVKEAGKRNGQNENGVGRLCRKCGKAESCVLLLPCRHLCLCTVCVSSLLNCPICKSAQTASLHINFSSS